MHSSYNQIDARHPFRSFLAELPTDPICDPRPDFIERGSPYRYLAAFSSPNANARLNRFLELLKEKKPSAGSMTSSYGANSAQCVLYLKEMRVITESGAIANVLDGAPVSFSPPAYIVGRTYEGAPPAPVHIPSEPKKPTPGVTHMPSY